MYNPRFPHSFSIKRASVDSSGDIVYDANGDPTYTTLSLSVVTTLDGDPTFDSQGQLITTSADNLSFGYRDSSRNTSDSKDVVIADYKIACPMFTTELYYGDIIEITDYQRTYKGKVVKKMTYNWGSNIWFDEIKN